MYERRLKAVAATITQTLADAALQPGQQRPNVQSRRSSTDPASLVSARTAHIIEHALTNEREEEILRLQDELASKELELSRLQT